MSYPKNNRRSYRNNHKQSKIEAENEDLNLNTANSIMLAFKKYSIELDAKHDRYERILKCSRDITTESKRIISLLHTIDHRKSNKDEVLEQAKNRISVLCDVNFLNIAMELGDLDVFQYIRAYSPGMQEFIEALTYYEYLSGDRLCNWDKIQKRLTYEIKEEEKPIEAKINPADDDTNALTEANKCLSEDFNLVHKISCLVEPTEYILGLLDLTGELLRRCITSLGSGDIDSCFNCCIELKFFYKFFLGVNNNNRYRELSRKLYTLRQSLLKCETVCYNVKVRGGEAAKWGLSDNDNFKQEAHMDEDEGFF